MKAQVVTTITTLIDLDTFEPEHNITITPEAGLPASVAKAAALGGARALVANLED